MMINCVMRFINKSQHATSETDDSASTEVIGWSIAIAYS